MIYFCIYNFSIIILADRRNSDLKTSWCSLDINCLYELLFFVKKLTTQFSYTDYFFRIMLNLIPQTLRLWYLHVQLEPILLLTWLIIIIYHSRRRCEYTAYFSYYVIPISPGVELRSTGLGGIGVSQSRRELPPDDLFLAITFPRSARMSRNALR